MCFQCADTHVHVLLNLLKKLRKERLNVRLAEHFITFSQQIKKNSLIQGHRSMLDSFYHDTTKPSLNYFEIWFLGVKR